MPGGAKIYSMYKPKVKDEEPKRNSGQEPKQAIFR